MDYWLIVYFWRRRGSSTWLPANMVWQGTIKSWFMHISMQSEEYVLVNALPTDKVLYDWVKDNI